MLHMVKFFCQPQSMMQLVDAPPIPCNSKIISFLISHHIMPNFY